MTELLQHITPQMLTGMHTFGAISSTLLMVNAGLHGNAKAAKWWLFFALGNIAFLLFYLWLWSL